jgi:outer membrane lipoprotein-sorting protein
MFGLWIVSSLSSMAFANPLDEHLAKIEQTYKDVKGIEAKFVQETSNAFLPKPMVQEGALYIAKPSQLHWEFQTPLEQHFYADAEKITVWSPVQNTVLISPNLQNDDVSAILTDLSGLKDKYLIQLIEDASNPQWVQFSLSPKDEKGDSALAQGDFTLAFDSQAYLLSQVIVKTENATTTLKFAEMTLNPTFEPNEFVFTPPEGADITDSRQ